MFRLWVIVGVTAAAIAATATSAGDKKSEAAGEKKSDVIKIETKEFEKALEEWFGLKLKSQSLVEVTKLDSKGKQDSKEKQKAMKLLLEVAQDLNGEDAAQAKLIFEDPKLGFFGRVEFHCFDNEGVRIARHFASGKVEGEIKGKKGDVFRAILPLPPEDVMSKTTTLKCELFVPDKKKKVKKE